MEWNVEDQPPELWDQFKTDFEKDTHIRIHPLLHWTELNVWEYIERESIPVIPLYFANGKGERYRSLGCAPCTFPIRSSAKTVREIIEELRHTNTAERSGRAQDKESEDAFEKLRRDGHVSFREPGPFHTHAGPTEQLKIVIVGHVDLENPPSWAASSTTQVRSPRQAGAIATGRRRGCRLVGEPD
jgi:hypothetical protein